MPYVYLSYIWGPTRLRPLLEASGPYRNNVHGFRSQPRPLLTTTRKIFCLAPIRIVINSSIGSLHDDSDILPSSQDPSHDPCHTLSSQSWSVDKISLLQTDMATTKLKLDHFEESTNSKMSHLQTGLESNLTRQISALDSK